MEAIFKSFGTDDDAALFQMLPDVLIMAGRIVVEWEGNERPK